jgi:hypothetical protein
MNVSDLPSGETPDACGLNIFRPRFRQHVIRFRQKHRNLKLIQVLLKPDLTANERE